MLKATIGEKDTIFKGTPIRKLVTSQEKWCKPEDNKIIP